MPGAVELFRVGFRRVLVVLFALGAGFAKSALSDQAPDIFTLARLTAWNRGPGELQAKAEWRGGHPGVVAAHGPEVVFKIDWHFADETTLRTLTGAYAAEVSLQGETIRAVSDRRTHETSSGPLPAAVARNAAALEIPMELPAAVGLLWGRLRVRAKAAAYQTVRDTGWREFPFVVVRTDLTSPALTPETARAVAIAYGDLVWLLGRWPEAAAERWIRMRGGEPASGKTRTAAGALSPNLTGCVAEAARVLSGLFPLPLRDDPGEGLATAADCLLACSPHLPADCPTRVGTDFAAAAGALRAAATRGRGKAKQRAKTTASSQSAPAVHESKGPPVHPLRNGDFAAGLNFWQRQSDAAVGSRPVSVEVEQEGGSAVLCLQRTPGALTLVSGGVEQAVDIPVSAATRLEAEVRVGAHSPAGGGDLGTLFPLTLAVEYIAGDGSRHLFTQSFYTLGKAATVQSATKLDPDRWRRYRSPLFAALSPPAVRIVRLRIMGAGRSFVSWVKQVSFAGK